MTEQELKEAREYVEMIDNMSEEEFIKYHLPKEEIEELHAGTDAVTLFEYWVEQLIAGNMPDPGRYEWAARRSFGNIVNIPDAPFYYLFMGFVAGRDFSKKYDLIEVKVKHRYLADD